jgi:hypothetical protein
MEKLFLAAFSGGYPGGGFLHGTGQFIVIGYLFLVSFVPIREIASHFVRCRPALQSSLCVVTRFAHCFAKAKPVSLQSARRS